MASIVGYTKTQTDTLLATKAASTVDRVTQTTQTGTTYTLALGDAASTVELNNASPITLTIPPNASVAFPVGTRIVLRQLGAGLVTVAPGAAVTIRSTGGKLALGGQYTEATAVKRGTNEWVLVGSLA